MFSTFLEVGKVLKAFVGGGGRPHLTRFLKLYPVTSAAFFTAYLTHRKLKTSFLNCKFQNHVANQTKSKLLNLNRDWVLGDIKKLLVKLVLINQICQFY